MTEAIILFTRVPLPGDTKTRLMPCYTASECAVLQTCFLQDVLEQCQKTKKEIFVAYSPLEGAPLLKEIVGESLPIFAQQGSTLASRMHHAIKTVLEQGYDSCVLIGSDLPSLQSKQILQGLFLLKSSDLVFIPTMDGGYGLVGMKTPITPVFLEGENGKASTLVDILERLNKTQYKIKCFDMISDIDVPGDLLHYRKQMHQRPELFHNKTGTYLKNNHKISVIIPVYNEGAHVLTILKEVKKLANCEIIFVDGGSSDDTVDQIRPYHTVLKSEKGRGQQMNAGAIASGGDILFFLHADSVLPRDPVKEITAVMNQYQWGCFGIQFSSSSLILWICALLSNVRARSQGIPFGDQGIFIKRSLFFDMGMFSPIPIMEDFQFSLAMKNQAIPLGMTRHKIITSARKFQGTIFHKLAVMKRMANLRKMYQSGVNPDTLVYLYEDL